MNIKVGIDKRFKGVWKNMIRRCLYKKHPTYSYYGGRGIKVCDRWLKYENFENDMYENYVYFLIDYGDSVKTRPTLDRIDNNKGYSKDNCRWINIVEQQKNRREKKNAYIINGLNLKEYCSKNKVSYSTVMWRIHKCNLSLQDAINKSHQQGKSFK